MFDQDEKPNTKERKTDRVFSIKAIEGSSKSSNGLVDSRLFTGDNKLHAVMDPASMLWSLKYEYGILPNAFKQRFTNFKVLHAFVQEYFRKRNIEIKEIID